MTIEARFYLSKARSLPQGSSEKIVHVGCGARPSMFVKNDDDSWWCYCHRCRDGGTTDKSNPRVKQKVSEKTGWIPDKTIPLVDAVMEAPYNFTVIFERFGVAPYVTLCTFSPDTQRIYFPDESGSLLGLDSTGKANARFYSPHRRAFAMAGVSDACDVLVTGDLKTYLQTVAWGGGAMLVMNTEGEKAALAALSADGIERKIIIGKYLKPQFTRSLKAL